MLLTGMSSNDLINEDQDILDILVTSLLNKPPLSLYSTVGDDPSYAYYIISMCS